MLNILLVEDNQLLAKGTAKLIERLGGHQVFITAEPKEIFRQCEAGTVELVIMDINLPGAKWQGQKVDGSMLSRYLKAQWKQIPIILVTAYAMPAEQHLLLSQSGADSCYTKPITDYDAFLDMITLLGERRN
ncbi:response regulator [Nostoc sp. UHCC 0926]|uniref:response regulator n=1 Tax=unclassified Nostoc TaxID=2593658 RepID=UPI00235DE370|nr:response regulator [Nostoc sp. UHCC 0926]WDD32466.1 response regulator [Nostoc sp. UHCC 0926]